MNIIDRLAKQQTEDSLCDDVCSIKSSRRHIFRLRIQMCVTIVCRYYSRSFKLCEDTTPNPLKGYTNSWHSNSSVHARVPRGKKINTHNGNADASQSDELMSQIHYEWNVWKDISSVHGGQQRKTNIYFNVTSLTTTSTTKPTEFCATTLHIHNHSVLGLGSLSGVSQLHYIIQN